MEELNGSTTKQTPKQQWNGYSGLRNRTDRPLYASDDPELLRERGRPAGTGQMEVQTRRKMMKREGNGKFPSLRSYLVDILHVNKKSEPTSNRNQVRISQVCNKRSKSIFGMMAVNPQGGSCRNQTGTPIGFQCFKKCSNEFVQCHQDEKLQGFPLNESNLYRSKGMDILGHIGHSLFFPDPPYSYDIYSLGT